MSKTSKILEIPLKKLQFKDVKENQLFLDIDGNFCQKTNSFGYNQITLKSADGKNLLWGNSRDDVSVETPIKEILNIEEINFV
jgi:hypothetical protein